MDTSFFERVPYPITTRSSISTASGSITTLYWALSPIVNSVVTIPTYDTCSVLTSVGILRVKIPSRSVVVPIAVPFTTIVAPITGSPFSSVTTPEIVLSVCCEMRFEEAFASTPLQSSSINTSISFTISENTPGASALCFLFMFINNLLINKKITLIAYLATSERIRYPNPC